MCTQVYMAPEYMRGELSMKVDAFAFGLVVLETLTGYAVCSPAPGHRNLLSMFDQELDTVMEASSTPRQASMLGPAQAREHGQSAYHRREM